MFGGRLAGIFFADTVPAMNDSACLNRRNRFEPCALCKNACTSCAIAMDAGLPVIDAGKCISCGLCASVCPSEALRLKDYQIFRRLTGDDELRCMKSGGIYCIKAMSPALVAAIIVAKPNIVLVMPCGSCELAGKIHRDNISIAVKFLDSLGVSNSVRIIRNASYENEMSRREMLSMLFMRGKNTAGSILEDTVYNSKGDTFFARGFLADKLSIHGRAEAGIFWDFAVSETCSACGLCEAVCPSGAWRIHRSDGKADLTFSPTRCTGCMLCVKKCPEKAIATCENFSWPPYDVKKREFVMNRCRRCGMWFIRKKPEQELCASCSGKKQ